MIKKYGLSGKKFKKKLPLFILTLPALIYVIIFNYVPMYGLAIAFQDYRASRGVWGSEFVGLKHFIRFVSYPDFWRLLRNTLALSLYSLVTFPIPIVFALLLNEMKNQRFKKGVQMISYAPHFISTVATCGMIILFVDKDGFIGQLYGFVTGQGKNLLAVPELFGDIYVWSGVWKHLGWGAIIYIAALSGVPAELVEAAKIDGANRLQVIWHINIPSIMPTIIIMFIMEMGRVLSVGFDKVFLLQNDLNLDVSNVISTYVYRIGIIGGQFSYSTAIGLFNTLANVLMVLLTNFICKKLSGTGLW